MGICISTASSEIYAIEHGPENVVYYEELNNTADGNQRLGSLHTQEGSKGLNQDCAIIYEVCLMLYCS